MKNKLYKIITCPNGIKMMSILPINTTGIAEAYISIRNNPLGNSKGLPYGDLNCAGFFKKLGTDESINDFNLCCEAIGVTPTSVTTNRLIYFTNIVREVDSSCLDGSTIYEASDLPHADGLITDDSNVTLFNYAADCAIIMFVSPKHHIVGSLHAAWKGSLCGIIENEVEAFKKRIGTDISDLTAVLCPCISQEFFEVGEEVAERFIDAGFEKYVDRTSYPKPHISLSAVNKSILLKSGLAPDNIYVIDDLCTFKDAKYFHSYRRGPLDPSDPNRHLNGQNGYFLKLK